MPGKCTSKSCRGHEVDIMHFSIGSAIPGRLYGGNPLDNRDGIGSDRFSFVILFVLIWLCCLLIASLWKFEFLKLFTK